MRDPISLASTSIEETFWDKNGDLISAAITMAIAVAIAIAVDRFVLARARHVADRIGEPGVSRAAETRLQLIRRLVFLTILVIGAGLALSQFGKLEKLATGILASSAVLGLVLGFAARQTIGNLVAGIMLAISQPIRIGDKITFEEQTGRVDDLTLAYTYIDPGDGRLMVVPNEKLASGTIFNHSTGDRSAPVAVSIWLEADADLEAARLALASVGAERVTVEEVTPEGVRLELRTAPEGPRTRVGGEEAAMREAALGALREAGVTGSDSVGAAPRNAS
jgi:small-conductance mechanosensitive channel